jgi:predicted secreted hydrolase
MSSRTRLIGMLLALVAAAIVLILARPRGAAPAQARAYRLADDASGYARATSPQPLQFPEDHGPHPDFQTEWWYYTGNLETAEGRHFGYQLTFFRRAILPPDQRRARASDWAADQIYMAHFALTDVGGERYHAFERFSRGAAGLAGAEAAPYSVWLEDWHVEAVGPAGYHLYAEQDGVAIDLQLTEVKPPVLQGDQGYSPKGPDPGDASYYYSLTQLASTGTISVANASFAVDGSSWMDHEFSTSALAPDQVGWDWFSIQLDNGSELMVFQLRRSDGSVDPFSSGTLIAPDGSTQSLSREDFQIVATGNWESPHTGARYPAAWRVSVPTAGLALNITPYLADQELNVSYAYWEGAVRVNGTRAGAPVTGQGYVELTGYAQSMQDQF